jgi:hypothetical protein
MLSSEQNNKAIVSSFQTQMNNEKVMSLNGNVRTIFPQFSFYVEETSFLKSLSFAEVLQDLYNNPIAESKSYTRKAGTEVVEERDVPSPRYVYEWMSSMLMGYNSNSNYPKPVRKKMRDDVVYYQAKIPFRRSGLG